MVLAVVNQKGGVGKTTLAFHILSWASQAGSRALAIDLDTQGNLSTTLQDDLSILGRDRGALTLFTADTVDELDITRISPNIDLLHGHQRLDQNDARPLTELLPRLQRLLPALLARYDLIFFDTPPSTGTRQLAPLLVATKALIPTTPDQFAVQGLGLTLNAIRLAQAKNPTLRPHVIINRTLPRKRHRATIAEMARSLEPLQPYLPDREAVTAAMTDRRPVWSHPAAKRDIREIWRTLMRRILEVEVTE